jgi:hypothetical protein
MLSGPQVSVSVQQLGPHSVLFPGMHLQTIPVHRWSGPHAGSHLSGSGTHALPTQVSFPAHV